MAKSAVPAFHNDEGFDKIRIGSRQLRCMGARPPFDHPHIFLDMGAAGEVICPYCSTLYIHDRQLHPGQSDPASCRMDEASESRMEDTGAA